MARFDNRVLAVAALLFLVPVAYYMVGSGEVTIALSLLSVVIVVASLYLMFGPSNGTATPQ